MRKPPKPQERINRLATSKNDVQSKAIPILRRRIPLELVQIAQVQNDLSNRCLEDMQAVMPPPKPLGCKKGCDFCCNLRTSGNFIECYAAAHYLQRSLAPADLAQLKEEMAVYRDETRGRAFDDLTQKRCPFLKDHACSIYDWRPMGCRRYNSYSAESCKKSMEETEWGRHIPMSKVTYHAIELPMLGVHHSLIKLGLDTSVYEFASAVLTIIEEGDDLARRWLAGERVMHDLVIPGSLQLEGDAIALELVQQLQPQNLLDLLTGVASQEYPLLKRPDWEAALERLAAFLDALSRGAQHERLQAQLRA